MSWAVPPWVYLAWDSLCFLYLGDCFPHYGKFQLLPLQIFPLVLSLSLSFPTIPKIWMLVHVTLSQRSLKMSSFLFILFSLFCSAAVISTILSSGSLVHSSASLILLLIPSSVLYSFLQFLCCLTLCALYIFFVEHVLYLCLQSFFQNLGSSSLSLLWIPFQCWYIAYFHFT